MKKRNMLTKVAALSMAGLMTVTGLPVAGLDGALSTEAALAVGNTKSATYEMRVGQKTTFKIVSASATDARSGSYKINAGNTCLVDADTNPHDLEATSSAVIQARSTGTVAVSHSVGVKTSNSASLTESTTFNIGPATMDDVVSKAVFSVSGSTTKEKVEISASDLTGTKEVSKPVNFVDDNAQLVLEKIYVGDSTTPVELDGTNATLYIDKKGDPAYESTQSKGKISGVGSYTVYVVGKGNLTGDASFSLKVGQKEISDKNARVKSLNSEDWSLYGAEVSNTTGILEIDMDGDKVYETTLDGTDCNLTYTNNTTVGTAKVKVEPKANTGFKGSVTGTFKVDPLEMDSTKVGVVGNDIGDFWLDNQLYTGSEIKPSFDLFYADEEVPYTDSRYANAYEIEGEKGWAIDKKDGTPDTSETYHKRYLKLTKTTDWKIVSYEGNKDKGDATITISGGDGSTSKFKNTKASQVEVKFTITDTRNDISKYGKAEMKLKVDNEEIVIKDGTSVTYNGKSQAPTVTVSYTDPSTKKEVDLTQGDGIDVTCLGDVDAGTCTVKINGATAKDTTTYAGTITKTFTITPKDINTDDIEYDSISSVKYNGSEKTPAVNNVKDKKAEVTLVKGKQYSVFYDNNINASEKATITLQGNGNYTGKKVINFTIDPADISDADIDDIDNMVYTGSELTPDVTGKFTMGDGSKYTLVNDKDYTLEYYDNVGSGSDSSSTAQVTVKGKNNFTGSESKTFYIVPQANDLSQATITLVNPEVEYDGSYHSAVIESVKLGDKTLETKEYELVSAVSEKNAGSYEVKVKGTTDGTDYYGGIASTTFTITPAAATVDFKLSATKKTYNGKAQSVEVKDVTRDGVAITEDDYTVSGTTKATAAGKKTVTVTLKGNYSGSAKKTWTIAKAKQTIKVSPASKTFKASKVKKAKQTFTIKVTGAKGTKSFKSNSKKVTVTKAGKVTVKKGTKKGTYKITVKAAATKNYNAAASKTVTIKVK